MAHFLLSGGEIISDSEILAIYKTENLEGVENAQKTSFKHLPTMLSLYENIETMVLEIVKEMHAHGIYIDREKLTALRGDYDNKREVLSKKITEKLGPINLNSPRQLGQVLVLEHKLNLPKTKTGQYTTTSEALSVYAKTNEAVREILEFRTLDKIINTYILPILERLDENSRIHPDYDLMSAATGRMAAHNPNIQSTPVTGVYGDAIRSVFAAPHGKKLIAFDYSQQELRILAHLSQDPKLHDAFAKGVDIHVLTASSVLQIPEDKVGKTERNIGKTLNFGIIYGETPYGLAKQLGKTPEECAGILRRYFETYYGVKKYFDNLMIHAKIHGFVETILGRRRGIPGQRIYAPKKSLLPAEERIIKNFAIQGSAADMTKKAMVDIWEKVMPKHKEAHLVMQIHDELVFEYDSLDEKKLKSFAEEIKSTMIRAIPFSVPVEVDWQIGDNWGEI